MLYISFVALRNRSTGEVEIEELVSSLTGGAHSPELAKLRELLRSPDGEDLRAENSHAIVVLDNDIVDRFEFPDPAVAEREHKVAQLVAARRVLADAHSREAVAVSALADATAAKGEREAAEAELAKLEAELGIEEDDESESSEEEKSPYEGLTIADLKEQLSDRGIETSGFRLRQEFVDALEADDRLSVFTVAELKSQAEAQGISTTGMKLKREFLDAIAKRERDAKDLADLNDEQLKKVAEDLGVSAGANRGETEAAILKAAS